jgi:hypothetical protein
VLDMDLPAFMLYVVYVPISLCVCVSWETFTHNPIRR